MKVLPDRRVMHLDLKGLPPTAPRLLSLLELCQRLGYNAILVEWEDMFPWTVDERFRCETAYTADQVRAFVHRARELAVELIPLVQCLGHMETPLRLAEYAHLRELEQYNDVMNPLASGAVGLVAGMMDDVLALMPDTIHFHLGGDEAWTFGAHPDTAEYIRQHGRGALYLQHVDPLLDKLLARGIRPLLWHDMMITWNDGELARIKDRAELCVWGYNDDPRTTAHHFAVKHIQRFVDHGIRLWAASAFKGADGVDRDLPDIGRRITNMQAWVSVASEYRMQGIVMTAWSRYSTNQMQTSPVDGALDALAFGALLACNGALPENHGSVVEAMLRDAGEWQCFTACRDCLESLAALRTTGWDNVRILRGYIACTYGDARRIASYHAGMHLSHLENALSGLQKLVPRLMEAFDGLVPAVWLERYLAERIQPLQDELADITVLVGKTRPVS
jgi:hexosaminidase